MAPAGLTIRREAGCFKVPLFEEMGLCASWTTREHDLGLKAWGRAAALRRLGIDAKRLVCPLQVHADRIAAVGRRQRGRGSQGRPTVLPATDALITNTAGTILSVLTADCLPVFLATARGPAAAGLVHAGWRGLEKGIVAKTVRRMIQKYGVEAAGLVAVLGPAIRPCCYEVSESFLGAFPVSAQRRNGKVTMDLAAEAARQLLTAGVPSNRIFDSKLCTRCCSHLFYSYRREGAQAGRSLSTLEILERPGQGALPPAPKHVKIGKP